MDNDLNFDDGVGHSSASSANRRLHDGGLVRDLILLVRPSFIEMVYQGMSFHRRS